MKTSKTLLGFVVAGSLAAFAGSALAQTAAPGKVQPAKDVKPAKEVKKEVAKDEVASVGKKAPGFSLFDTEGKEHTLSSLAGKIVVLEWFNPECPYVKMHHETAKTFNDLHAKYSGKDVVFFAINSNAAGAPGSGKDRNVKAVKDFDLKYPVLLDDAGATGKAYGAKNTPVTFIIGKDGTLVYKGAPDDATDTTPGKTNYVSKALDEILAGKAVSMSETKPYGCAVKYKN